MSAQPFRLPYRSDVSEEEWAFAAPGLALVREDAPQREHSLRDVYNALRDLILIKCGCSWRYRPTNFLPWWAVYQPTQPWMQAGVFASMAQDLRILLRLAAGRPHLEPTAAIWDSRTLQSTPESGAQAGWEGAKRRKGSKLHCGYAGPLVSPAPHIC